MNNLYAALLIAVAAGVTILIRFLPFIVFRSGKTPPFILYLGKVLPPAVMGMLVIYCLKSVRFEALPDFLPALIASAAVVVLHLWRHNSLISILGGTLLYMILIRVIV